MQPEKITIIEEMINIGLHLGGSGKVCPQWPDL